MTPYKFHVIGNGYGSIKGNLSDDYTRIYFNGASPANRVKNNNFLTISNRRQKNKIHGNFEIVYEANPNFALQLENKINANAFTLEKKIGAWPSCGFALIHTIWDEAEHLHIDRIGFDPSLQNTDTANNKKVQPSVYHNWIGERQISIERIKRKYPKNISWTSLVTQQNHEGNYHIDEPFSLFLDGFSKQDIPNMALALRTNYSNWSNTLNDPLEWQLLEKLLYIQRGKQFSPNWWLFDEEGSMLANSLARLLRQHQNFLYLSAASFP
jgi:hypothetical protein